MRDSTESLQQAQLEWQQGVPSSTLFDDIYFNRQGGVAETRHVFLDANRLAERFAADSPLPFVVAETGFGTGLNFLCCRALWLEKADSRRQLHYISCEKYPLSPADLQQALSGFADFSAGTEQLLGNYPPPVAGAYTLVFDGGRILLTLLLGDALETLPRLDARVDAWFLDGFAPARNPELWNETLFCEIARLSRPGTSFATFTAAGVVRRGLQDVGFEVSKQPGFGRKREMLSGRMTLAPFDTAPADTPIWFQRPAAAITDEPVVVIGAGIAGASTAYALACQGFKVRVLERNAAPATEGSGNPQGALYAKLPAHPTTHSRFHLSGMIHTSGLLAGLEQTQPVLGQRCGVLQLAVNAKEAARQQQVMAQQAYPESLVQAVDAAEASDLAGIDTAVGGLFFPTAGWVAPGRLAARLLAHSNIECHYNTAVTALERRGGRWHLGGTAFSAQQVVVCCASQAVRFDQLAQLPLKPIRGQTSQAKAPDNLAALKTVVCGEGYISPPLHNEYCFGASFVLHDPDTQVREQEHRHNLDILCRALPPLGRALEHQPLQGKVAFRCSTPDYLPMAGPVADHAAFIETYARLRDDARWAFTARPPLLRGLFVNLGHGSKGLLSGPICGQLVAAYISGTPLPLAAEQVRILHPARFIIKNLIRKTL